MAQVGKVIAGAALIAGAVILDVTTAGAALGLTSAEISALAAMGASTGLTLGASGVAGLLAGTPPGQGSLSRNPAAPWQVVYGQVKTSPTLVYIESNGGILSGGSNPFDKTVNQVSMIACHPVKSVDQVRFNGKSLPLGPGGTGAQSTEWTYTPPSNQGSTNISSIKRVGGLVTLKLAGSLSNQNGSQLTIINVADRTFNCTATVTQPNPLDTTTFTYLNGGPDTTSSGGYVRTTLPDWKNRVHVDRTSCLGNHTSTFPELLSTSVLWTSAHKNLGRASVYIAHYWDTAVYSQGLPTTSFVVSGKNDIFDPRTGTRGYTTNAALIIADYLTQPVWGFGLNYGTDIPLDQLTAAANLADEEIPLAAGGTEKRYTINMAFNLSQTRGAVLQDMLNACAGRISIVSGQYIIQPGAWVGPSLSLDQSHLIGPIEYKPYLSSRDACNGVKGSFVSPSSNWESGDFPPYCEDANHGYVSDKWLAADNGVRVWKDVSLHATTSSATAQRLAKSELERIRREGRLTLHCNMAAYPAVAGDVIEFSYSRYGWVNKTWEVLSSKLIVQPDVNGGAPSLSIDLELAETDSTVYDWSSSEELAQSDTPSPAINNGQSVTGPITLVLQSGPTTSYVGADGIALPRILASWVASPDAAVQSGGFYRVEYQRQGDTLWIPAGDVSGTQTQIYLDHVVSGWQYNVQVQAFRGGAGGGVGSGWAQAGPLTVSATTTSLVASSVKYPDGTPVSALQPNQAGADMTAAQPISHTGSSESIVPNGNFLLGNIDGWIKCEGAGSFSYGSLGNGQSGLIINGGASVGVGSPTFAIIPGQKYRFTYNCFAGSGSQGVYFRINYSSTYREQIYDFNRNGLTDFVGNWSGVSTTMSSYTYDFVCPAGIYFASAAIYEWGGATASIYVASVTCTPFSGVAQWGADQTSSNTAAGIANQGALATINQANTVNIVAGAVNTSVSYSSTVLVNVPSNTVTTVASATITTGGGYVKVRAMMEIFSTSGSTSPNPQIVIHKGGPTGPQMAFYGNVYVVPSTTFGGTVIAIEAVDNSPALAQQYTVTAYAAAISMQCDSISFVVENAKV